jgi:superfamily II DNA or RNA helicase
MASTSTSTSKDQVLAAATSRLSDLANLLSNLPPAAGSLRDYQRHQLVQVADSIREHGLRLLVQLPTGGGKTHELAAITLCAHLAGLRVLVIATRTRLVRQIHERLEAFDIPHGVIAAQMKGMCDRFQPVQIASADTLHRRCMRSGRMPLPSAEVVIFDEAHLALGKSRLALLDQYPDALRIGFTATPARKSGLSLSAGFDRLLLGPSILDLIHAGQLVRPRIFNIPVITQDELQAIPKSAGDYAEGQLATLLSQPKLIGDVVSNWLNIAHGRRTIVFACDKRHGAELTREFNAAGVTAELLTDQDEDTEREAVIARMEAGQTTVIINCFLMAYGIDIPTVEAVVLARPTRSVAMYLQMVGRGLRTAPGKSECLLIDHGRVVENLGLPHADRDWTLAEGRNVNREAEQYRKGLKRAEQPRTCRECSHMWLVSEDGTTCRHCGWKPTPTARAVDVEDADLAELDERKAPKVTAQSPVVQQFAREALGYNVAHHPEKWAMNPFGMRAQAWFQAHEKFGLPKQPIPPWVWSLTPTPYSPDVGSWLMSRQIRYAKRRRAA